MGDNRQLQFVYVLLASLFKNDCHELYINESLFELMPCIREYISNNGIMQDYDTLELLFIKQNDYKIFNNIISLVDELIGSYEDNKFYIEMNDEMANIILNNKVFDKEIMLSIGKLVANNQRDKIKVKEKMYYEINK